MGKAEKPGLLLGLLGATVITLGSWLMPSGLESKVSPLSPKTARADKRLYIYSGMDGTVSEKTYDAINEWVGPADFNDPEYRKRLAETNYRIFVLSKPGDNTFKVAPSFWPFRQENPDYLERENARKYNLTINGGGLTFPLTNYIEDYEGSITFTNTKFNGELDCVRIEETSSGTFTFIGDTIKDLDDLPEVDANSITEPNYVGLELSGRTTFTGASNSSIYYNGTGGAKLRVTGCVFDEAQSANPFSILIENFTNAYIVRNIFCNSGKGVQVRGENEGSTELTVGNCNFNFDGTGVGISFEDYLAKTKGNISNNIFAYCAKGIENCENVELAPLEIITNNYFDCLVPHEGRPSDDHILDPDFVGGDGDDPNSYQLAPTSEMIDLGRDIGLSSNGWGPDIGAIESPYESCVGADFDQSGLVDFPDFAILANEWLDGFDPEYLKEFVECWLTPR